MNTLLLISILLVGAIATLITLGLTRYRAHAPIVLMVTIATYLMAFLAPLKQLLGGNQGDELFILAQITNYQHLHFFADFYYHNLPPFYPPLYFWLTGLLTWWTPNAIVGMKIGLLVLALPALLIGVPLLGRSLFRLASSSVLAARWYWLLLPLLCLAWLDLPELLTKPYETVSALLSVVIMGWLGDKLMTNRTITIAQLMRVGIIAGLLFLSYYFWWILLIPLLTLLVLWSALRYRTTAPLRTYLIVGVTMLLVASPYLIPFLASLRHGMENWQARHLVLNDFNLWLPFFTWSWHMPIAIAGVVGMILYWKIPYIKIQAFILMSAYTYQLLNYLSFLDGGATAQPSKPFLFLGGAALTVSAGYLLVARVRQPALQMGVVMLFVIGSLITVTLNEGVQTSYAHALTTSKGAALAQTVAATAPDYTKRTWLSSGIPEINAFIPLKYYIAHNAHFSHQAARFEMRLELVEQLLASTSPADFNEHAEALGINALLLYTDSATQTHPLFFWVDNAPYGGTTLRLDLNPALINTSWQQRYADDEWMIYTR